MRSLAFNAAYYVLSVWHVLAAVTASLVGGRVATRRVVARYVRRMVWAMRVFAGIKVETRGRERLPSGAFVIAAKHQSWGDGFCMYSQFDDVAIVTGDHLEKLPLFRGILRNLGAIVVDSCGGAKSRRALSEHAAEAHAEGRKILIYPEGHLAPVGTHFRYKTGVWHMARNFDMPVVPVATNLGLYWPEMDWTKRPGTAVIEFLDPIMPGEGKVAFMAALEAAVEARTAELVAEATGEPVRPSVLTVPKAELERRGATTEALVEGS